MPFQINELLVSPCVPGLFLNLTYSKPIPISSDERKQLGQQQKDFKNTLNSLLLEDKSIQLHQKNFRGFSRPDAHKSNVLSGALLSVHEEKLNTLCLSTTRLARTELYPSSTHVTPDYKQTSHSAHNPSLEKLLEIHGEKHYIDNQPGVTSLTFKQTIENAKTEMAKDQVSVKFCRQLRKEFENALETTSNLDRTTISLDQAKSLFGLLKKADLITATWTEETFVKKIKELNSAPIKAGIKMSPKTTEPTRDAPSASDKGDRKEPNSDVNSDPAVPSAFVITISSSTFHVEKNKSTETQNVNMGNQLSG